MMWRMLLVAAFLHGALASTLHGDEMPPGLEEMHDGTNEELELGQVDELEEKPEPYEDEFKEDKEFEASLNALSNGPVVQETPKRNGDVDAISHVHAVPIEEEEALNGGYIFDVDDANRNPDQRCYVRNQGTDVTKMSDNIENSIVNAQDQLNQDGTNRAQWTKCLPPPMYTLLSVESFAEGDIYNGRYEKRMRNATDFYATLKWLHNEACSHIRLRLENKVMLSRIREEVNYRSRVGLGYKIKTALDPIIKHIVKQYHSVEPGVNAANAKTMTLLKDAIGPLKQALRVAKHSSMVTLENGEGRRRNNAEKSAKELLDPLYGVVMKFDVKAISEFLDTRPGPLDDRMTGDSKQRRGLGNPMVGTDRLPDSLKSYGRCGKPLFDYAGYSLYTITISQNDNEDITILTKDGWLLPKQVVGKAMSVPLRTILPPDAYEVETKTTAYQDDLFAQGNLACGSRADGLWTLTSYDRNSNENKVTATQDEGYFCVWMLNDLLVLPENQRAGFSNTEFVAESPQEMARVMNGDVENYKRYFPKPGEKYKYYHCHYSPRNSGSARVHSFQHQAERHYPGGIRQYCNCDWRRMGMIVSRCDCTLDATANGGCRRAEMEMLNEHTQFDLWRKDGNKKVPSRVALVHGDLAEGKVRSYTYQNNRRRREPDNRNIFQEDTGRVRQTTKGNGGNNVVCSVNGEGVPDNAALTFQRNKGNIQAKSTVDPTANPSCKPTPNAMHEYIYYQTQSTSLPQLDNKSPDTKRVVRAISYGNSSNRNTWSGYSRNTDFAVRWMGDMNVPNQGSYFFQLSSDDGSRLSLTWPTGTTRTLIDLSSSRYYNRWHAKGYNQYLGAGEGYKLRIDYYQKVGISGLQFTMKFNNRPLANWMNMMTASCGNTGANAFDRSFFSDLNGNGIMDYPECRRRRTTNAAHRRRGVEDCNARGNEFPLRDIYASSRVNSPAGGVNYEFVDENGNACDILKLKRTCKPADAGTMTTGTLARHLAKFCDVPAALYQVPVNASGVVPEDFGAVQWPMPIHGYNGKWTNYRAKARAEFGALGSGTLLFCAPGQKNCAGNEPLAVQGTFNGIKDENVFSVSDNAADNTLKSKFYPTLGGSTTGTVPSAVNTKWTQAGTKESGTFNNDVMTRYRRSTNPGTLYAQERVASDIDRREGVTCLNGKYVYARKMPDGSRPVVSTIREAFNRNGPVGNGQWACRYVGVHCNANNCNNNGNGEVPGPFVEPKIRAKKVEPTPGPTPAPTEAPTPAPTQGPTKAPAGRRRRRGSSLRRRGGSRRRSPRRRSSVSGKNVERRRRRRGAKA